MIQTNLSYVNRVEIRVSKIDGINNEQIRGNYELRNHEQRFHLTYGRLLGISPTLDNKN